MENLLLERAIVNLVANMVDTGILRPEIRNHSDFGRICFPEDMYAVGKWKNIRLGYKGKPKNLSFQDILAIARTAKMPLSDLILRANIMIEKGWRLSDDICVPGKKNEEQESGAAPENTQTDVRTA